jgi:cytochrome b
MRAIAVILGLVFAAIAIMYWTVAAGSLPSFMPGYEAGSAAMHMKHGIAAAAAAVLCLAFGWYAGGARA